MTQLDEQKPPVEKAFQDYLDREAAGERPRRDPFLDAQPAEIRSEVARMLSDYERLRDGIGGGPRQLAAGKVLDSYLLIEQIGRGGMAVVWEAEDQESRTRVALKLLSPQSAPSLHLLNRFLREARAGMQLEHPGIVRTFATGEANGLHYITQELVPGGFTLADFLSEKRKNLHLPGDYYTKITKLFIQVTDALQHAHDAGITHRDIKPSNILITADDRPKVADFGLAQIEDELGLSRTGDFLGTPFYVSPEQALAKRIGIDHRTDIFSLGATLYEALTFTRAFDGDMRQQILQKITLEEPVGPTRIRSQVPQALSVICLKALEKQRERRYQTMADFAADLRCFLNDEAIAARPVGRMVKSVRWMRRHPTRSVASALLLAGLPVVAGLGTWMATHWDDVRAQEREERQAKAQEHLQGGFLELGQRSEQVAQVAFSASMDVFPTPEGVMGKVQALLKTDGPEAASRFLNSQQEMVERYPDLGRARALILQDFGEYEQASELLSSLPDPTTSSGWFLKGQRLADASTRMTGAAQTETRGSAANAFLKAIFLSSTPQALYFIRCVDVLTICKTWKDRRKVLEPLLEMMHSHWPTSAHVAYWRGFGYQSINEMDKAVAAYRKAISLDPRFVHAFNKLGIILNGQGKFNEAIDAYRSLLRLEPDHASIYNNLGFALSSQGNFHEAIEAYQKGVKRIPHSVMLWTTLGMALERTGRYESAIKSFGQVRKLCRMKFLFFFELDFIPFIAKRILECETKLNQYHEALDNPQRITDWKGALQYARLAHKREEPNAVRILRVRGEALAEAADVTLNPNIGIWNGAGFGVMNQSAWLLVSPDRNPDRKTNVHLGLALAQAAAQQAPHVCYIRDTYAWALFANGRHEAALAELRTAIELALPQHKSVYEDNFSRLQREITRLAEKADP